MKLYHYVHCPFCVRVRFALAYLEVPYESVILPYDDEKTPLSLTGVKMLPILTDRNGHHMNESLDIIKYLDVDNKIPFNIYEDNTEEIEDLLSLIGSEVHSLAMPYWIWTPEFNEISRQYFQKKKEIKRGPFKDLVKHQSKHISKLDTLLNKLEGHLQPFYRSNQLSIADIILASHLWGMYIVPEYQFSNKIHTYLQLIKNLCHFDYHQDFWK